MFSIDYNPYIAIIGDIIKSKNIQNRYDTQEKLRSVLASINMEYSEDIASNFMITLGDEFQGLLKNGTNVIDVILKIEKNMYPVQFRFGIGIGEITTKIDRMMPLGADGPAYYNARNMIDSLKESEKKAKIGYSSVMIYTQGNNNDVDLSLNAVLSLCAVMKSLWSKRQREIISAYIESGYNQYKAAEKLGISQPSVSKGLTNAGYHTYKRAMDTVKSVLSEVRTVENV